MLCEGFTVKGKPCRKSATYYQNGLHLCNLHSESISRDLLTNIIEKLSPIQNEGILKLKQQYKIERIEKLRQRNLRNKEKGKVLYKKICDPGSTYLKGYVNVFLDGKKYSPYKALSPQYLGPVHHGVSTLPSATALSNFYYGCMVLPEDFVTSGDSLYNSKLLCSFYNRRQCIFSGKPMLSKMEDHKAVCFAWYDENENEVFLSVIQFRRLYCCFYEDIIRNHPLFLELQSMIEDGYNVQVCGKDRENMHNIQEAYNNPNEPFGYEAIIYTMLRHNSSISVNYTRDANFETKEMDQNFLFPWRLTVE